MSANSIKNGFDRNAANYAEHASVQSEVASRFVSWIEAELRPMLPEGFSEAPRKILEVGSGTGLLTKSLLDFVPQVQLTALDISQQMLVTARQQLSSVEKAEQIRWVKGDISSYSGTERFDLAFSSSCLHWCSSLQAAFECIQQQLKAEGFFAFCIMSEGTLAELHSLRQSLFPSSAPKQLLPSSTEVRRRLVATNFRVLREHSFPLSERHESAVSFFRSLSERGTTGPGVFTGAQPLKRNQLALLAEQYQRSFPHPEGGVLATYNVSSFIAGV